MSTVGPSEGGGVTLTDAEREALAEYGLVVGTFITGRWAEVMSSDDEPADDWQEAAAREAVDLFAPMGNDLLAARVEALTADLAAARDAVALLTDMADERFASANMLHAKWQEAERVIANVRAVDERLPNVDCDYAHLVRRALLPTGADE